MTKEATGAAQKWAPTPEQSRMAMDRCSGFIELCEAEALDANEFIHAILCSGYWQGVRDAILHIQQKHGGELQGNCPFNLDAPGEKA